MELLDFILISLVLLISYFYFFKKPQPSTLNINKSAETTKATDKSAPSKPIPKRKQSLAKSPITIVFCSQTGTAQDYAHLFSKQLSAVGLTSQVCDIENIEHTKLLQLNTLFVFFASTYGEGDPPDSALDFSNYLKNELSLEGCFMLFGLGNKTYAQFNSFSRFIDKRFQSFGMHRLGERGEGDDDDNLEEDYIQWKNQAIGLLSDRFQVDGSLHQMECDLEVKEISKADHRLHYNGAKVGKVVTKRIMNRVVHLDVKVDTPYVSGDHIAVYPQNRVEYVDSLCKSLDLNAETFIQVKNKITGELEFPECSIRDILTHYVDIHSIPSRSFLECISPFVAKDCRPFLKSLQVLEEYTKTISSKHVHLWDLIEMLKAISKDWKPIPIASILDALNKLNFRYYSISTSSTLDPDVCGITCSLLSYKVNEKNVLGLCSNHLFNVEPQSALHYFIRTSSFRLPSPDVPIIMIGAGTGVAPFRAFVQERYHLRNTLQVAETVLFFGARTRKDDFLYESEWPMEWNRFELITAFSRDQEQKVYVQHRLDEYREKVQSLVERGAFVYVCGDAKNMALSVSEVMDKVVHGGVKKLKESGRYQEDVWS